MSKNRYEPRQNRLGKGTELFGVWSNLSDNFVLVTPEPGKPPAYTMTRAQAQTASDRLNKALAWP